MAMTEKALRELKRRMNGALHFIEQLDRLDTYAEIGVKKAFFIKKVLQQVHIPNVILVDPWSLDHTGGLTPTARVDQALIDYHYERTKQVIAMFPRTQFRVMRMTSAEAAPQIPDGSIDLVNIDADHRYEAVIQDIKLWMPKVREGGFLIGDDYELHEEPGWDGKLVKPAVDELLPHATIIEGRTWGVQR